MIAVEQKIITLLAEILSFSPEQMAEMDKDTNLLGEIPEFDSMAVVSVITGIEEMFEITIDDDDISADTFETVGSLVDYVEEKLEAKVKDSFENKLPEKITISGSV